MKKHVLIILLLLLCSSVFAQNYVLTFDGNDDYIYCSNDLSFKNLSSYTMEAWIFMPNPSSNYQPIFVKQSTSNVSDIEIYGGNNGITIAHNRNNGGTFTYVYANNIPSSEWVHYTVTFSSGTIKTYINGINDQVFTGKAMPEEHQYDIYLGKLDFQWGLSYFEGKMDDIRVWNVALDQATIQAWKNKSLDATHPNWDNLVGYWKFNEGSGQIAHDSSGNGNDGQLGNSSNPDSQDPSWINDNPLPVELSSFTAIQTSANYAKINWTTQSETGLSGYNIYRNNEKNYGNSTKLNSSFINPTNTTQQHNYSYIDDEVELNQTYYYWLESIEYSGNSHLFGPISINIEDDSQTPEMPDATLLRSAYPNPFNPRTLIAFSIKTGESGKLTIYNMKGQIVKTFSTFENGEYKVEWNGKDNSGKNVSSGVYFYKLQTETFSKINKMLLLK